MMVETAVASLRGQRAELRASMSALEHALAAPVVRDPARWVRQVDEALVALEADLRVHIDFTEGPDGLYREILENAPRLTEAVTRLAGEHQKLRHQLAGVQNAVRAGSVDADTVRALGTALLGRLVRHRQRGADLVYEAYEVDLGGDS